LLLTEDLTRHISAHRRLNSTYCCSQKTQLDTLLLTEDSTQHIGAHRRLHSTYCCSQKTQLDILLLTEYIIGHISAHRRLNSTYWCSQKTTRHTAAHRRLNSTYWCSQKTQIDILLLTEDSAPHTAAHRRLISIDCCSQKTQRDILVLTDDLTRHISAHRRQLDILVLTEDSTEHTVAHRRLFHSPPTVHRCQVSRESCNTHTGPLVVTSRKKRDKLTVWKMWPCPYLRTAMPTPWMRAFLHLLWSLFSVTCKSFYVVTFLWWLVPFSPPAPRLQFRILSHICLTRSLLRIGLSLVMCVRGSWRGAPLVGRCTDY
jgi:hypothetical protein